MNVSPVASSAKVSTALTNLGIPNGFIAQDTVPLLQQLVVALGNVTGGGGGSTSWNAITGKPSNVVAFGNLADAEGVLTNNGSGDFSYTGVSVGGDGATDNAKLASFSSLFATDGSLSANALFAYDLAAPTAYAALTANGSLTITNGTLTTTINHAPVGNVTVQWPTSDGLIQTDQNTTPLSRIDNGGATNGQAIVSNGTSWAATTLNYLPLAGGTLTGALTIGVTSSLLLGTAGSAVGNIGFRNATSGTATLAPPTGALGTYTVTLPGVASTLSTLGANTYTGLQTFAAAGITGPAGGTLAIGATGNITITPTSGGATIINGPNLQVAGPIFMSASLDVILNRSAAATLKLGLDAAGVTNQMFTAASRITSDGVGANLTIAPGNGRGGAGGTLILSTYTTAGAATIGTLTSRMTIDTAGAIAFPNVTAVTTETVVSDTTWPVTINGVAYKICLKA